MKFPAEKNQPSRYIIDVFVLVAGGVLAYGLARRLELFEWFYDFSRRHEAWQLDELLSVLIVLSVLLGVLFARRWYETRQLNRRLQAALDEIHTLRGIIPICSHCKKIRTDEGYWQQLEVYISRHSDALFSHGICPDCVREHYPDLAPYVLDDLLNTENAGDPTKNG